SMGLCRAHRPVAWNAIVAARLLLSTDAGARLGPKLRAGGCLVSCGAGAPRPGTRALASGRERAQGERHSVLARSNGYRPDHRPACGENRGRLRASGDVGVVAELIVKRAVQ